MTLSRLSKILLFAGVIWSGCSDADLTADCCSIPPLQVEQEGARMYMPNAFTPNSDGLNDIFFPAANARVVMIKSLKIKREDKLIFESLNFRPNHPEFGWDGRDRSGVMLTGIFDFEGVYVHANGEEIPFEGKVCTRPGFPLPCVALENNCRFATQHNGQGGLDENLPIWEDCE